MKTRRGQIRHTEIGTFGLGIVLLVFGFLYYAVTRDPNMHYIFPIPDYFKWGLLTLSGGILNAIPSFLHTAAFILLTVSVLSNPGRKIILLVTLFWVILNSSFEFAQALHNGGSEHVYLSDHYAGYLTSGTFDLWDLAAIMFGGIFAYLFSLSKVKANR